ncbi:hypothetical protein D3C76_37070 [compost metagenome]
MRDAVALPYRSTDAPLHEVHDPELETRNREALLLVRRVLRDSVVIAVNEVVVPHGMAPPQSR